MPTFNARETSRRFNGVLDDLLAIPKIKFDRTNKLLPSEVHQEVWYQAGRDIKIAYLPPRTYHSGTPVPSIHVRVYHQEWTERVEGIYRRHGLTPEVTDHELFGKIDIDAHLR